MKNRKVFSLFDSDISLIFDVSMGRDGIALKPELAVDPCEMFLLGRNLILTLILLKGIQIQTLRLLKMQ